MSVFLIGRRDERAELDEALRSHRVITLVGPAGVGKTTLARAFLDERGGVLCRCDDHRTEADLVTALALGLGIATTGRDLIATLERALARNAPTLLFDGVEHLLSSTGRLIERLLEGAPSLRCIVTSREPLGLSAERVLTLAPFMIDEDDEKFACSSALVLWTVTVQRDWPEYRADRDALDDLRRLIRTLDGLPLAIELAAGRRASLTARDLDSELARRFALLRDRRRNDRHASLEAALEASWKLLDDRRRALLVSLSAFPGAFDARGVRFLIDGSQWLDDLESLIDTSWIVRERGGAAEPALRLLSSVREFAREREPDRHAEANAALAERFCTLAQLWDQAIELRLIVAHADDLLFAAEHRLARGDVEAAVAPLAAMAHLVPVGKSPLRYAPLVDDALSRSMEPISRAKLLYAKALLGRATSNVDVVRALAGEAAALARTHGAPLLEGKSLHVLGALAIEAASPEARVLLERALSALPAGSSEAALVSAHLAIVEQREGNHRRAAELLRGALDVARRAKDDRAIAIVLSVLGAVYGELDETAEGRRCLEEAIVLSKGRDVRTHAYALSCFGALLHAVGELEEAADRLSQAVLEWTRASGELYAAFSEQTLGVVLAERGRRLEAREHLERARRSLGSGGYGIAVLGEAHLALLDIEEGDHARAVQRFEEIDRSLTNANPFREAVACLRLALDSDPRLPGVEPTKMDMRVALRRVRQVVGGRTAIGVARDGTAIRTAGGIRSLKNRPQLVRLLSALIESLEEKPEAPVAPEILVAHVWPGERILPGAARTRLYAAVRRLRTLGLEDALVQTEGGYRLDEGRVRVMDARELPRR